MDLKRLLEGGPPDKLASLIATVEQADALADTLATHARIRFLRNFTVELIEPSLKFRLYEAGIRPDISFGDYDTIQQELLAGNPEQEKAPTPDIIVLSLMLDRLDASYGKTGWEAGTARERVLSIFDLAAQRTTSVLAVNTFIPPFHRSQGIASFPQTTDAESEVRELNNEIRRYVAENSSRFFLMDWERYLRMLGEERSIDYRYWNISHAPFKNDFLSLYAGEIARLASAIRGKARKCLVLDCDNTLWGGVVGEEGVEGIQLDPNEWPGKAFYQFQQSVATLLGRGILVALCSKNNEQDVWDVLDTHPHSVLKREHISAWRINWENKASNIAALASELNLGLDSLVFIDDDPAQCELVTQTLPDVKVLQVPTRLYNYPELLPRNPLFDTLTISSEDLERTQLYQQEAIRTQEMDAFDNIDDFLKSLDMEVAIHRARDSELARVAQLTQKTNQFNLTTRRYSNPEIEALNDDPDIAFYTMTVSDKFGPLGLTGVLIARLSGCKGDIDTLLLSCRVLGRTLEYVFVDFCLEELERTRNITEWTASFIHSAKNKQVVSFWEQAGFKLLEEAADATGKRYGVSSSARPGYNNVIVNIVQD